MSGVDWQAVANPSPTQTITVAKRFRIARGKYCLPLKMDCGMYTLQEAASRPKQKAVKRAAQLAGHDASPLYTPPLTQGNIRHKRRLAKAPICARVAVSAVSAGRNNSHRGLRAGDLG